ncbi:L-aspartate oxidase [Methylocella silvestris BL2]|uniref:L-aspartate oxidase n=2 Tax=Methylocella silvestris TaxID=199596 RepID=B8EP37_METSB|nr:L-aspartate oxidase [Methylocella silvestris BL2]
MDATGACIIIGGGLAGLSAALALAPAPVILVSKARLGTEASSVLAQGGVAASVGPDDDLALHLADTLKAGDGLCDAVAAKAILAAAPAAIENLVKLGAPFDRDAEGRLMLGLEAAHSRRRIVHAGGDGSGREIMRAMIARARNTPSITFLEGVEAHRLIIEDGAVAGLVAEAEGEPLLIACNHVVIATGGVGGLYLHGTNPAGSFGSGLALAARAGAEMADLEFVQFHPTALDSDDFPLKLISETVRGEGAILVDERGHRFMAQTPGKELAPRDIVARAVFAQLAAGHRVFLDAREAVGSHFAEKFPAITGFCHAVGIDPATQPIPIRPAAHYHMGGIKVDLAGRSSIEGLWACGEAACTGLHGANRLASNSLLEAIVCGGFVAESVAAASPTRRRKLSGEAAQIVPQNPAPVRKIMSRAVGVLRERDGLRQAAGALLALSRTDATASDAASVGLMIAVAALKRQESRGAHARTDYPGLAAAPRRTTLRLDEAVRAAEEFLPEMAD